ncbi:uncharacterized protein LOC112873325 [Panicum hallii]|uniref:uncharacterized protein LOC112873325 n=1 Tax=Panicum hallii TaxID=206008 RepID=UPI000DF4E48C|nr:uncharacterized protein LOC112873325 [Panicum hallii]
MPYVDVDLNDHPDNTAGVSILPVVVTPTICNLGVERELVDGGAGLNLLSPKVFHKMQIGERKLLPSMPFYGVTVWKMIPLGQVELPGTFGERVNFRTENVVFSMAYFDLPYNAILGHSTLAKFMAAVHYAYITLKILGPSRVISVKADVKWLGHCAERLYEAMEAISPDDGERLEPSAPPPPPPARQRIIPDDATLTKAIRLRDDPEKTVMIGAQLSEK